MRLRLLPALVALLAVVAAAPRAAAAEPPRPALVILDRGSDAGATADTLSSTALDLVRGLAEQGRDVLLLAVGVTKDGRLKLTAPPPSRKALSDLAAKEGFAFEGPTDPRDVLRAALVGRAEGDAVDLLLVGPFSAPASDPSERRAKELARSVTQWNDKAPEGSRILPIGLSEGALGALDGVRGTTTRAWFVVAFSKPEAIAQPFSPLSDPDDPADAVRLSAEVRIAASVLRVGSAGDPPPLLATSTDLPSDTVAARAVQSLHLIRIERPLRDGRTVTLSFSAMKADDVIWLCDVPTPLTFVWDRLAPDAHLLAADGSPQPIFEAMDAEAGTPVVRSFRIVRTRSGPTPAWRQGKDPLPGGLRWSVGEEAPTSADLVESELRVEFHASPATPVTTKGTLTLGADGMPSALTLPFVLRVGPGRATLVVLPQPAALPPADADELTRLHIRADNGNTGTTLPITARCETGHLESLSATLVSSDGRSTPWSLSDALHLPVGVEHTLSFSILSEVPMDLTWPCTLTIVCGRTEGVETKGEGAVTLGLRSPRLVVEGEPAALRVEDGKAVAVRPLVLRLDADGGDGDWLISLLRSTPVVETVEGDVRQWDVKPQKPGIWHVVPRGPWRGATAGVFDGDRAAVRVQVEWPYGETPGTVSLPVDLPARWGTRGWLFVGLAAIALILGLMTFVVMRAPQLSGTLLYTSPDLPGTVGRLDLTPVGRRAAPIFVDGRSRLTLATGAQLVARIRPTRVGGMLEVLVGPETGERRLLVDGLALRLERHNVRYVSGRPAEPEAMAVMEESPDLLGSEFDIESGRIDSL